MSYQKYQVFPSHLPQSGLGFESRAANSSSSYAETLGVNLRNRFLLCWGALGGGKNLPEPQGLITCSCYDVLTIRAHGQVEDSHSVSSQSGDLLH